jgi:hypothetical protein
MQILRRFQHVELCHNHSLLIRRKFHPSRKVTSLIDKEDEREVQLLFHWYAVQKRILEWRRCRKRKEEEEEEEEEEN